MYRKPLFSQLIGVLDDRSFAKPIENTRKITLFVVICNKNARMIKKEYLKKVCLQTRQLLSAELKPN